MSSDNPRREVRDLVLYRRLLGYVIPHTGVFLVSIFFLSYSGKVGIFLSQSLKMEV